MGSSPASLNGSIYQNEKNILVAGSSGCGKTSLIFTLARGIFPDPDWVPGRFDGWSIPAAAMPKDFLSADLRNKAGSTTKPFLVNLTFWEDRPRLNFWEKILLKRKQLAKQAKNEAKEEEISAYMAEAKSILDGSSSDQPTLQRRSSQVSYATVNGITLPNFSHTKPKKASKSESSEDNQSDEDSLADNDANLCAPRPYIWPEPDVIVLCYSSIDTDSFQEAETVIWPDLNERYPDTPIILVATKCDARPDEEIWSMDEDSASKNINHHTTLEMANALTKTIGAKAYIECSAMENRGLRHVVEEAVWILNSAITSTENALMSSFEAIGSTGASHSEAVVANGLFPHHSHLSNHLHPSCRNRGK